MRPDGLFWLGHRAPLTRQLSYWCSRSPSVPHADIAGPTLGALARAAVIEMARMILKHLDSA
jgi:hypothetical protein